MPEEKYFVAVDGRQLDGEHDMSQVRQICSQYAGRQVMVWNEGLGSWTDPKSLPTFRVSAAPAPAPVPAPAPSPAPVPAPAPAAQAPVRHPAAPVAVSPVSSAEMAEEAGALKGLLDLKLETFVAPKLLRLLYVIVVVLCGLAALGGVLSGLSTMVTGFRFSSFFAIVTGLVMVVLGPVLAVFYLALMRVIFEGVRVLFQIRERLEKR